MISSGALCIMISALLAVSTSGFVLLHKTHTPFSFSVAAKNKKGSSRAKGFGKTVEEPSKPSPMEDKIPEIPQDPGAANFLQSVEGGSSVIPKVDESVPVEKRTADLLRNQYGLRTREEQQEEQKKQEAMKEQRKKLEQWKKMADEGEDFDLMKVLPGPVLIFIDGFLKAGVAICTVLFVLAGCAITVEAWSKSSGNPLPEDWDNFITYTIEPNFTPGLLVLLGFSVSLGAFAAAQLSSSSSTYREDR